MIMCFAYYNSMSICQINIYFDLKYSYFIWIFDCLNKLDCYTLIYEKPTQNYFKHSYTDKPAKSHKTPCVCYSRFLGLRLRVEVTTNLPI